VSLAGKGAIQAPGVIPSMFLGSLPQSARVKTDVAKAKAALKASGVADQKVTMIYPSDLTINGVPFSSMAQKVQSSLKAVGFNIEISGSPTSNWLTTTAREVHSASRSGGPTTPTPPTTRLHPGSARGPPRCGRRAPMPRSEARSESGGDHCAGCARGRLPVDQRLLNQSGPFFPLIQPTRSPCRRRICGEPSTTRSGVGVAAGVAGVRAGAQRFATRAAG
jgi:peptide/nickel transport system substrate-binding protein